MAFFMLQIGSIFVFKWDNGNAFEVEILDYH